MALNTAQRRGSAMLLSVPFRPWTSAPDGTIAATDRQSLAYLCSAIAFGAAAAVVSTALTVLFRSGPRFAVVARSEPRYDPEHLSTPRYGVIRRT